MAESASQYTVELLLAPAYLTTLGSSAREFQLGYQFVKRGSVLKRGDIPCRMHGQTPRFRVTLPNAERVAAKEIHLQLAH